MALEPITRQEQIIAGKDLEPITRMERFLKEYGGGAGGVVSDEQIKNAVENYLDENPIGVDLSVTGATVGQTVTISAVDENGVPTAWEAVDAPTGGSNEWKLIADFTTTEEVSYFAVTNRLDGSPLKIDGSKDVLCFCIAAPSATNTKKTPTQFMINSKPYSYVAGAVYTSGHYTSRWLRIENFNGALTCSNYADFGYSSLPGGPYSPMNRNYDFYNDVLSDHLITSLGYSTLEGGVFGVGSRIMIYERG